MRFTVAAPFVLMLAACGGDGGSGAAPTPTPTPSAPNTPPSFTSPAAASVVENVTAIRQVLASDAQNDPITLTITGGADAALFSLDVTGNLAFRTASNFEAPGDANGDNVYEVTVTASDGRASSTQDLRVTVTNHLEGIFVRPVTVSLSQPTDITKDVASNRYYITRKNGVIASYQRFNSGFIGGDALALLLWDSFTVDDISTDGERGLLAITTGPTDASGGTSIFVLVTAANGDVQIRRYSGPTGREKTILLSVPHAANNNHNGGFIEFGPDGLLYAGIGDGGGVGDPNNNAQNPNVLLGKIVRLAATATSWGPAPGNPYASGGGNPYVFALGLRNPFRGSFAGTDLIIADVGQDSVEELNLIATTSAGANFGWPYREGAQSYRGTPPAGLTLVDPVLQYRHGTGPYNGASITGGAIYRGEALGIKGHYIFGDFVTGHIWSVPLARLKSGPILDGSGFELRDQDFKPDRGTTLIDQPIAIKDDGEKGLYILDLDGNVFHVHQANTISPLTLY